MLLGRVASEMVNFKIFLEPFKFFFSVGPSEKISKDFSGYVGASKSLAREILREPTQNILNEDHIETECNLMPAYWNIIPIFLKLISVCIIRIRKPEN